MAVAKLFIAISLILRKFPTKTHLSIPSLLQFCLAMLPMLLVIIIRVALSKTTGHNVSRKSELEVVTTIDIPHKFVYI